MKSPVRPLLALYCALAALPLAVVTAFSFCRQSTRAALKERLGLAPPGPRGEKDGEVLWVHGASVGEILAAEGLVRRLLEERPSARLVLSTFTTTGRSTARARYGDLGGRVDYTLLPADWCGIPGRVLDHCRPSLFVILETELWPALFAALDGRGIPLAIVNGRISRKSFPRYRALKSFFRPFLETCGLACVRTEADGERFRILGVPAGRVVVAGNMKHDALREDSPGGKPSAWRRRIGEERGAGILVAGSLRGREGEIILDAFALLKASFPGLRIVIAPRHPAGYDVSPLERSPFTWVRWSEVPEDGPDPGSDIVLVDTMGDLAGLYAVADVAFVGGTIDGSEGHNLMEPALCGVPVLYGPGYDSFLDEGEALLSSGGGFVTGDREEIVRTFTRLFSDDAGLREAGEKARDTARSFGGAVDRTMTALEGLLPEEEP